MKADNPFITELHTKFNTDNSLILHQDITDWKIIAIEYLAYLEASGGTVIVTDTYLFSNKNDSIGYQNDLLDLLKSMQAKKIIWCTKATEKAKVHDSLEYVQKMLKESGCELTVMETGDFHDRFWVCLEREKGIYYGTSINGIGKAISLVDILSHQDVIDLIAQMKQKRIAD